MCFIILHFWHALHVFFFFLSSSEGEMVANYTITTLEPPKKGDCKTHPLPTEIGEKINITCNGISSQRRSPKLKYDIYEKGKDRSRKHNKNNYLNF